MMTKEQLEALILEQEKKSYDFEPMRTIIGALMAASFSMIVLLLAFIQDRDILLDASIFFLFLSLILLMDLFLNSVKIQTKIQGAKTPKELFRQRKKIMGYAYFGIHLFNYGLIFLTLFFNLFFISILFFIYLFYKRIYELIESIKALKDFSGKKDIKYARIKTSPLFKSFKSKLRFDVVLHSLNLALLSLILIWVIDYFY